MIGKMYPDHTDRTYLVITITNVGKRPILVKGIYGMLDETVGERRGLLFKVNGLPTMLKESEYFIHPSHDLECVNDSLQRIYVMDSAGRKWKMSRRNLRNVIQENSQEE